MTIKTVKFTDNIISSDQPTASEYQYWVQQGYAVVINLATSQSENTVVNADHIVDASGGQYIQLPIVWDNVRIEQYQLFEQLMQYLSNSKVWVHCAKNMRASAFVYLFIAKNKPELANEALTIMHSVWTPCKQWQQLIDAVLQR